MKISKLQTLWIILVSIFYTIDAFGRAVIKNLIGTISRSWVDKAAHVYVERILNLVRVSCRVYNPNQVEPQPNVPTIIMCNHSSVYDIPLSYKAFPKHSIRMLAKKELSRIPIMGSGMRACEFLFIDRKNRRQAIKDLEQVDMLLQSGIVLWIAPEGTRSKNGKLAPFKKGCFITAINTKATIIPMGIKGAFNILPARTLQLNINQQAEIHIGKPIDASKFTLENKELLISDVYNSINQLISD
ncbi:MAG: lysophospholipid acyltransferase family protein [Legionella sp.]